MPGYDAHTAESGPFYTRPEVKAMNLKFYRAMIRARKRGLERFAIGALIDNTPLVPTRFEPVPRQSFMRSAAAYCSDASDYSGAPGARMRSR
jgi:hypothetical protein